jgi:CDP-glucose 4,6-dehydratase
VTAAVVAEKIIDLWGEGDWLDKSGRKANREMHILKLNSDKAATRLGWFPAYNWEECLSDTVKWYKTFESFSRKPHSFDMMDACMAHIEAFTNSLKKRSTSNLARAHEVYTHAS